MITFYFTSMVTLIICTVVLHFMWPNDFRRQECTSLCLVAVVPIINTVMAIALGVITLSMAFLYIAIFILRQIDKGKYDKK